MPQHINSKNFDTLVLNSTLPVVVDVWADWCGPCKMITPHFAAAEEELKGKVRFVKLDADKNQKLVRKYKVMGIPTLLFFKDGELVDRSTGVIMKAGILKRANQLLNPEDRAARKSGFNWKFWEAFSK
ncbi:MAG: thioredoxin [Lewinellaceae bacterium]|nr:thioredoxin [Lewinellaceae bacterium]